MKGVPRPSEGEGAEAVNSVSPIPEHASDDIGRLITTDNPSSTWNKRNKPVARL